MYFMLGVSNFERWLLLIQIDENLVEDQFGFWRKRRTREAILFLRNSVEKRCTVNQKVYIAFVDLLKAFDNLKWKVTMKILRMIKIDYRNSRIIGELSNINRYL